MRLKLYNRISENHKIFKKTHNKIIQKQLQMRIIKNCLKKYISQAE